MIRVSALVAYDVNRLIGVGKDIPWKMRDDLKEFKQKTVGHYCVVGRKTLDAMPVLTDRKFVVVSGYLFDTDHNPYDDATTVIAKDVRQAIALAKAGAGVESQTEVFVIGGGEVYRHAMPYLDRIYATEVDAEVLMVKKRDGVYFPDKANELWREDREAQIEILADDGRNQFDAIIKTFDRIR